MRVLLIIVLFLQGSAGNGQTTNRQVITLDEAIETAVSNNPNSLYTGEKKKLTADVKSAWYLWLFSIHKWRTLQEYQVLIGDLKRIALLRYNSGDIESIEKSSLMDTFADTELSAAIAANDLAIIENKLSQLLVADHELVPADTSLSLYQVDKGTLWGTLPENQSGAIVLTDPVSIQYKATIREKTIRSMQLELDGLFIRLQYYHSSGLVHAGILIQDALAKFNNEDIDYLEYFKNIAEAFRIKLGFLETLNKYNQSAIQLEYYAY